MRTALECLGCMIVQAVRAARLASSDPRVQERILREALTDAGHVNFEAEPVIAGRRVQRVVRRLTGNRDPYRPLKRRSTALALKLLPDIRRQIFASRAPLAAALSVATAANALDFGMYDGFEEEGVRESLLRAVHEPIGGPVDAFADEAASAQSILYLADNAGEIVFDRLVIELLNPAKVTLAVRGRPILNDATLEDARAGGLTDIVLVIDTGSDLAGVVMDECSGEFQRHFRSADLVIAKGQGNYETLDDVVAPIWFALKVKCAVVARATGRNVGESVLCRQRTQSAEGREIGASVP